MQFFNGRPKRIHSDAELEVLSKNDQYQRKKWIADAITIVFMVLIFVFGAFVIFWLIDDQAFRNGVKKVVLNNLVGIVISGFVIIGYSFERRT